jgi:hypothetical protein
VISGVFTQDLGHADGIARLVGRASHERNRGRTFEQIFDLDTEFTDREADQGVLVHLELAARLAQGVAQRRHLRHVEAAVLGEHGRVGVGQLFAHLGDDCDLLWSGVFHYTSSRTRNGCPPWPPVTERTPAMPKQGGRSSPRPAGKSPFGPWAPEVLGEQFSCEWRCYRFA